MSQLAPSGRSPEPRLAWKPAAPPAAAVGDTLGVEEEYHLVDAETFDLLDSSVLQAAVEDGTFGPRITGEISTTQIEATTPICRTLDDVRAAVTQCRRSALDAAATVGGSILAASTHPYASWQDQRITAKPRYLDILERWQSLALQQVMCGCHVHVGMPDLDTAVLVMDGVRPYLPLIAALTGSSPFHEGIDTGYDSYRTLWYSRCPVSGPAEPLQNAQTYLDVVAGLQAAGVVDDSSHVYWDVRPSYHLPTLEFRFADVCSHVDDVVLTAALVRSLSRTVFRQAVAGDAPARVRSELLDAARWRAARYGVTGDLFDLVAGELVPAAVAVRRLLDVLRDDLDERGEWDEVFALPEQVLQRGTSTTRQREVLHRTGELRRVAADLVRVGTGGN